MTGDFVGCLVASFECRERSLRQVAWEDLHKAERSVVVVVVVQELVGTLYLLVVCCTVNGSTVVILHRGVLT